MANKQYKDMTFKLAGASTSVKVDISAQCNSIALASAINMFEYNGAGVTTNTLANGLAKHKFTLNGWVNSTVEAILGPIMSGTSVAKPFACGLYTNRGYTGSALPSNIQFSGASEAPELWSADFEVSGALTRTSVVA